MIDQSGTDPYRASITWESILNLGTLGSHLLEYLSGNICRLCGGDDKHGRFTKALNGFRMESDIADTLGTDIRGIAATFLKNWPSSDTWKCAGDPYLRSQISRRE
jgi:hypothetical protein